ncbi:hypothetical protein ACM39_14720 [Chryseobacterium sp. FH2]|nr:hypothetical protein ACM39_14720 [Chryseobacterium sp. FH2]
MSKRKSRTAIYRTTRWAFKSYSLKFYIKNVKTKLNSYNNTSHKDQFKLIENELRKLESIFYSQTNNRDKINKNSMNALKNIFFRKKGSINFQII